MPDFLTRRNGTWHFVRGNFKKTAAPTAIRSGRVAVMKRPLRPWASLRGGCIGRVQVCGLVGELASWPSAFHHFAAVFIERIVDDPLGGVERMVVLVAEMAETFGDRQQARTFGLMIERVVG